jgi:hypothetical protein
MEKERSIYSSSALYSTDHIVNFETLPHLSRYLEYQQRFRYVLLEYSKKKRLPLLVVRCGSSRAPKDNMPGPICRDRPQHQRAIDLLDSIPGLTVAGEDRRRHVPCPHAFTF